MIIVLSVIGWLVFIILVLRFFEAAKKRDDSYNRTKDIER
tara:strand:- start:541 stop:660 length:120 start_codon:yes stop_codon:yes gene_type:complete